MAGASGYVLRQVRGTDLVEGIRRVAAGDSLLDPAVTARVLERVRNPKVDEDTRLARLTPTEERILETIAEGRTNRDIGGQLHLAEKTGKYYVSTVLSRLEVSRRAEAAVADRRARQNQQPRY
jgi:two-component system response regulator DevR